MIMNPEYLDSKNLQGQGGGSYWWKYTFHASCPEIKQCYLLAWQDAS
jgi:hypothetical protein